MAICCLLRAIYSVSLSDREFGNDLYLIDLRVQLPYQNTALAPQLHAAGPGLPAFRDELTVITADWGRRPEFYLADTGCRRSHIYFRSWLQDTPGCGTNFTIPRQRKGGTGWRDFVYDIRMRYALYIIAVIEAVVWLTCMYLSTP